MIPFQRKWADPFPSPLFASLQQPASQRCDSLSTRWNIKWRFAPYAHCFVTQRHIPGHRLGARGIIHDTSARKSLSLWELKHNNQNKKSANTNSKFSYVIDFVTDIFKTCCIKELTDPPYCLLGNKNCLQAKKLYTIKRLCIRVTPNSPFKTIVCLFEMTSDEAWGSIANMGKP